MTIQNEGSATGSQPAESLTQNRRRNSSKFTPRLHRLASALLAGPRTVRELMDVLPSNNVPEYIKQLREQHGLTIPCEHVKFITVDSVPSWFGRYNLTAEDRQTLNWRLNAEGGQ